MTANQSARPPTIAASLAACTNGQRAMAVARAAWHSTKTTAANTKPPVATSFIRRSAERLARSARESMPASAGGRPVGPVTSAVPVAIAAASRVGACPKLRNSDGSISSASTSTGPSPVGSRSIRA